MVSVRSVLRQIPDPRGKKGRQHPLEALIGLMLLSMLSGRKGMMAAFRLGRTLTPRQLTRLGFRRGRASPCHATLTMRAQGDEQLHQIAIDGKTLRGSKDAEGKAEHVLSGFCLALEQSVGHTSSRGKGMEIPDALRLLDQIDLAGKIVTGDAIFCQKTVTSKVVERGGDYVFPAKNNQKDLRGEIETAFNTPVFPLLEWQEAPQSGHGRIDQRRIEILPAEAMSEHMRSGQRSAVSPA